MPRTANRAAATDPLARQHRDVAVGLDAQQEYVRSETARYKYPRVIDFAEALPRTSSGKVQRGKAAGPRFCVTKLAAPIAIRSTARALYHVLTTVS